MAAPTEGFSSFTSLKRNGFSHTVGAMSVTVYDLDSDGNILLCSGSGAPTDGETITGMAKGCIYRRTNGGSGTTLYINEGTASSTTWVAISSAASTTYVGLSDGPGSITAYAAQIGNAGGTALVAGPKFNTSHTYTAGNVLYGDGSKFLSGTADTAGLVAKAGNQTGIAGDKTFTGTITAGGFSGPITGSGAGLTAGTVKASALQASAADLGAADVNINLGNTNGAFVTNLTIDGTLTAGTVAAALSGTTIEASDTVTFNGTGNQFGNASTDTFTMVGRLILRNVTDAGPMTATAGTKCELVYCNNNDKIYVCTATGSPATWAALN